MPSFLPLLFLLFSSIKARQYLESWRASILFAAVITATIITISTEALSLVDAFSFYPLIVVWILLTMGAAWMVFSIRPKILPRITIASWPLSAKLLLAMIMVLILITGITACLGSPNTWDSMTYHLSRIMHWIQDRTIAYYPTNITRQLFSNPWAEYAIAQVFILGGSQTSANLIQWSAMLGSLVGVSLIAEQLGANRLGQLMAAVLAVCLPMGLLESVSTQTDYACAFWLVAFVFFLIRTRRQFASENIFAAGLSLGLALLTKGNSYVFALPFLIWYLGTNIKQRSWRGLVAALVIIACALGLNAGQYCRTAHVFGSPSWTNTPLTNQSYNFNVLEENILRNVSIHAATPWIDTNEKSQEVFSSLAHRLGADINDQSSMLGGDFGIHSMNFDEDYSGNLLHALFFGIVVVLLWFFRELRHKTGVYTLCVLCSFLLFCLIVRFQPWNSRFHLPLFILFCPVAGIFLEYFLKRMSVVLIAVFWLAAMPWAFLNSQHPWVGGMSIWKQPKIVQYFYKRLDLALPYVEISSHIKSAGCQQVGLLISEDTWEYPWWVLLHDAHVRIEDVGVNNPSQSLKYPLGDFKPCVIIASEVPLPAGMMIGQQSYTSAGSIPVGNDKITILLPQYQ